MYEPSTWGTWERMCGEVVLTEAGLSCPVFSSRCPFAVWVLHTSGSPSAANSDDDHDDSEVIATGFSTPLRRGLSKFTIAKAMSTPNSRPASRGGSEDDDIDASDDAAVGNSGGARRRFNTGRAGGPRLVSVAGRGEQDDGDVDVDTDSSGMRVTRNGLGANGRLMSNPRLAANLMGSPVRAGDGSGSPLRVEKSLRTTSRSE